LIGDVGEDGGAARRDFVFGEEEKEAGEEIVDGDGGTKNWQILRTFSLDTELPVRVGFESQSPAGPGAVAEFSAITYDPHRIGNIYK